MDSTVIGQAILSGFLTGGLYALVALGYPLNYQWQFNGQAIADATNQSLTLTSVTGAQIGLYSVVVAASR